MTTSAALLFVSALVLSGSARAASDPVAYDAKAQPLDDLCKEMLTGNGYEIHDDGKVWDKIGETTVTETDMPYLLSRLASAKRMRALLEINNIITRYDAERLLTPEDKEAVRVLVRQNWIVFGIAPRNDFRSYFSVEERESLDRIPPRFEAMSAMTMTDPSVESVTAAPPSVTALPPAKTAAPAVAVVPPSITALPPAAAVPPSVTALPPAAPAVPPSITALPPAAPAVPPSITALPPAAPPAVVAAPAPAAPAVAAVLAAAVPAAPVPVAPPPVPPQAPAVVAAPAAVATIAVASAVIPTLTPLMELPSLSRGSPFTPAAPAVAPAAPAAPAAVAAAPAVALPSPVSASNFTAVPAAPPKLAATSAAPSAPSSSTVVANDLGTLKLWTPPAGSTVTINLAPKPAAVAVSTPAAPPVAAAPPPEAPKAAVVGEAEYDKFVAEGPYNAGGKAVLELIGKRAPDFCLPLLRRTVVLAVPQIVSDGARTGTALRAGFTRDAANPLAPPLVALSPGPVYVEVKRSMFGPRYAVLLPESPQAWADLGVARPPLEALRPDATPASTENGDWGVVRVYADGSRRGSYSTTEMSGELLEQLLLLGLSREGLDASPYAARRWARTARLMFYARMKEEMQQDNFLDPDRRAELRGWLDHPDETDDLTAAVWSGSRRQILDPRRGPPASALEFETRARATCVRSNLEDALSESSRRRAARVGSLESLLDAGVVDAAAAKSAAEAATDAEDAERRRLVATPPPCPPADATREEGLRKAVQLMAESARAERLMRERKAGIESHAL